MIFNSWEFVLFFPVVFWLYYALPQPRRWMLLLAASYFFYASWNPWYLILIVVSTLIDYAMGLKIASAAAPSARRSYMVISVLSNLAMLFFFKYFNFFMDLAGDPLAGVFGWDAPRLNLLLPVGISFYTFQSLSYTIDVYRRQREPETHFGIFALYVSYFPQLVAGPIERSTHLLPQFRRDYPFEYARVVRGLRLMLWGLFKKIVIADRLALTANTVYNEPFAHGGVEYWIATYAFAFQIYCDFSAYSDIAIGSARCFGHEIMTNFERPYFAKSIGEFWRRWHISLSTWFRDYVYIPLGGSRVSLPRWAANIFFVFVVSGLWHGAGLTFVIWGALHGIYLVCSGLSDRLRARLFGAARKGPMGEIWKLARVVFVFHLVCLGWIFFRANERKHAFHIVLNLFEDLEFSWEAVRMGHQDLRLGAAGVGFLLVVELIQRAGPIAERCEKLPAPVRWAGYLALALAIFNLGVFQEIPFIYFQF